MADNTFNLDLQRPGFGELDGTWGTGALNSNFTTLDGLFGATSGHRHTGQAGDGPKIEHGSLLSIGTMTHAQIEAAILALEQRVDEDSRVGRVRELDSSGQVQIEVTEVSSIDFVGCTVEQTAQGVAKVTPNLPSNSAYEITAPVNHFDAFVGPPGMPLGLQSWEAVTLPNQGTFNIQGTGNGLEARPEFTNFQSTSVPGNAYSDGKVAYQLSGVVPHSEVQRVCAVVERAEFEGPAGAGVSEQIQLRLSILSSGDGASPKGLFLVINRTGSAVDARFVVTGPNNTITAPIIDGTSSTGATWTGKTADFLLGQHEMSLSKDSVTGRYWLHYYYNKGLVYRYEEPVGGNNFFDEVRDVIFELEADPNLPDFGHFRMGCLFRDVVFASDPNTAVPRPLFMHIDSFMASSVGDRLNPKFIGSGYGGEIGAPPSGDEVCPNTDPNPYEGLTVGDTFTPFGGGNELKVIGLLTNPDGFVAEDQGTFELFVFYCEGAGGGNPGTGTGSGEEGGTANVNNNGNDVQVGPDGQYAITTFTADVDVPTGWVNGNVDPADVIAAGDPLPTDFISGQAVMVNEGSGEAPPLGGPPKFNFTTGTRLPLGTNVTAEVNVSYDTDDRLTATFTDLITIEPVLPSNTSTKAWVYKNNTWSEITETNKARRGDGLALTFSAKNVPMPGFWEPNVGFGKDYRINNNDRCELLLSSSMFEGDAAYFTSFERGGPAQTVSGDMPTSPVAQNLASDARPSGTPTVGTGQLTDHETVLVVGRIDRCAFNPFTDIRFSDYTGANQLTTLFDATMGEDVVAQVAAQGTLLENSTAVTVDVLITYPDPGVGGTTSSTNFNFSVGEVDSNVVLTSESYAAVQDGGPGDTWTVMATLTFNTGAAETFTLIYNDGCALGETSVNVDSAPADPDPPTPNSTISESSLYQCEPRDLTVTFPAANITAGDQVYIRGVAGTCSVPQVSHTFTATDASVGYSTVISGTGIVGQTPQISVGYYRPTASNPISDTQTLTLGLETPSALTIFGISNVNFDIVYEEEGLLYFPIEVIAQAPWRPGFTGTTVASASTNGGTATIEEVQIQSSSDVQYVLQVGDRSGWATGDTITLSIPNHDTCSANAGSTDFVITLEVNSSISGVRSGQIYNQFPFNMIIEDATTEHVGATVEVIDINQTVLQDLGTIQSGDIFPGSRPEVTTEARIEGIWDIPLSAYGGSLTDQINLYARITNGSDVTIKVITKTTPQGPVRLEHRYLPLPETLQIALDQVGSFSSQLESVSEGSVITVLLEANPLSIIDPSLVGVTGFGSGTVYTPNATMTAVWSYSGGESTSVPTNPISETSSRLKFALNPGNLAPGEIQGYLSLTLTLGDASVGPYTGSEATRTYLNLIPIVSAGTGGPGDPGGGGPVVDDMSVGS